MPPSASVPPFALPGSDHFMRAVFDHTEDAVFFLRVEPGPHFVYELVNERAAASVGLLPPALVGRTASDFFPPDEARRIFNDNLACLQSRAPVKIEREIALPFGAHIYRINLIPLFEADGSVSHILAFAKDVTGLRHQQILLAESEALACVGGWALDCATRELVWTPGTYRIFEKDPLTFSPTVERTITLFTEECRAAVEIAFRRAMEDGGDFEFTASSRLDSGRLIQIHAIAQTTVCDGRPIRLVGGLKDITAQEDAAEHRLRLEAQLRRAQKMEAVGTLAGGIAHDFNNILAGIMGNAQLAALDLPEYSPASRFIDNAYQGCLRARDLVRRILTFSRQAEQPQRIAPLRPIIEEALALLRASLPASVNIRTRFEEADLLVLSDPGQIHQIVLNLGTNAAQAMRETGGTLTLELAALDPENPWRHSHPQVRADHTVRFSVCDTGPGIPRDIIERIFDPFFTTKPTGEGSGLGLAIVHGIVETHGGAIVVDSRLGEGTTFHIFFPGKLNLHATPANSSLHPFATAMGAGQTILVIDDEVAITGLADPLLRHLGYTPLVFNDPRAAVDVYAAAPGRISAVLCDLSMPSLDGMGVIKALHAINPNLPVILMTGFLRSTDLEPLREAGVRHLLSKPFSLDNLAVKLREVLASA